ncbi:hypothetical protein C7212DRAFT_345519 [Tuber magnatum]|uniref:Uncharacterized protein n=1 Tax=Tuber magnatum TaxID=42249 RepID=A0A317SME3_9PEZI|nr:hypothetical protein C7212DRAFT_345519 [Tuber magnatum]
MTRENPFRWEEWVKARLLPLTTLLFLASSAIFGTAVAETNVTTNGIAVSILTIALLTIFYTIFNIASCFIPSFKLRPTLLCVIYSLPIPIWLFLTMFELTEVKDISDKANSYNSSHWGEGSGFSHGCSWADAGRYPDKYSYDRTCSLLKGRFSISWIAFFLFGPKRVSDQEEEERVRQARRDEEEEAETGVTERTVEGHKDDTHVSAPGADSISGALVVTTTAVHLPMG